MTFNSDNSCDLTLSEKVNRLFDVCRGRMESEQTVDDVATSVSVIVGQAVSAEEISRLRGTLNGATAEPHIIRGLVKHFCVPDEYLTTNGSRAAEIDTQLRLLAAVRDANAKNLTLRAGSKLNPDILGQILAALPPHPDGDEPGPASPRHRDRK